MSVKQELRELAELKRVLVLEAGLQRCLLDAGCEVLRERARHLKGVTNRLGSMLPWLLAGATAIGVLAARNRRELWQRIPSVLLALAMAAAVGIRTVRDLAPGVTFAGSNKPTNEKED